ncbi:hypothetical protein AB0J85_03925 [Micromonospora echinofusca]|uniref:hypothetical protein n=1 Tax=Micromonospora echinofusca TaxID=47858 RepID=UPI003420ED9E
MEVWAHGTELYEVNSYYSLPDDAWQYELTGMSEAGGHVAVVILTQTRMTARSRRSRHIACWCSLVTGGFRGRSFDASSIWSSRPVTSLERATTSRAAAAETIAGSAERR